MVKGGTLYSDTQYPNRLPATQAIRLLNKERAHISKSRNVIHGYKDKIKRLAKLLNKDFFENNFGFFRISQFQ